MSNYVIVLLSGLPKGRVRSSLYRPSFLSPGKRTKHNRHPKPVKEEMLPGYGLMDTDVSLSVYEASQITHRIMRSRNTLEPYFITTEQIETMLGCAADEAASSPAPRVLQPNPNIRIGSRVSALGGSTYGFVTQMAGPMCTIDCPALNAPIECHSGLLELYTG